MLSSISSSEWARVARVATFLAAVLALGNAVVYAIFHSESYQTMAVKELTPDKEVLVLGSSRVQYGIDARALRHKVVSLPANYENLVYAERLFAIHGERLASFKSLRAVVIEVDVATLAFDTDQLNPYGTLDLGTAKIAPFPEWIWHFDRSLHRVLAAVFNWRLTPKFVALWRFRTVESLEPLNAVPGHIPSKISIPYPELSAETEVRSTLKEVSEAPDGTLGANETALVQLVKSARERGLKVLLLRFPLEPALRAQYPADWDNMTNGALTLLKAQGGFDGGVAFLDLTRDARFISNLFRDSDHLNQAGADALAPVLDAALDTLLSR